MSTVVRLKESTIPMELKTSVAVKLSYDWDPADTEPIYMCLFESIAKFLGIMKTKEGAGKTALLVNDYKGNLMMGAIVEYIPAENEIMPGNWAFSFTFDPEDVRGINPTHLANDVSFHKTLSDVTLDMIHYRYANTIFENDIIMLAVEHLINCLDKNATPEGEFCIDLPGFFTAKVIVKDDHKIMAVEPSASLSRLVKGDEEIEV